MDNLGHSDPKKVARLASSFMYFSILRHLNGTKQTTNLPFTPSFTQVNPHHSHPSGSAMQLFKHQMPPKSSMEQIWTNHCAFPTIKPGFTSICWGSSSFQAVHVVSSLHIFRPKVHVEVPFKELAIQKIINRHQRSATHSKFHPKKASVRSSCWGSCTEIHRKRSSNV